MKENSCPKIIWTAPGAHGRVLVKEMCSPVDQVLFLPGYRPGVILDEKEYLGAGMGFLIHNILWPRGQRNVKNPMASLAFQGRPEGGLRKNPWKAGPKAVNDAWRSTQDSKTRDYLFFNPNGF